MGTRPIVYVEDTRPMMHAGVGAPDSLLGVDGDTYIDVPNTRLYGPKADGDWGSGVSLRGADGADGATGPVGPSGSTAAVETGVMQAYAGLTLPTGYLWCNGASVSRSTYATLFSKLVAGVGTATVTIASPGVFTLATHGLVDGDCVYLTTTGALPTGLAVDTSYFVVSSTTNTFQLSATRGGAAINTSGSQSGTHTVTRSPWGGITATNFAVPDLRGRTLVALDNLGGTDAGVLSVANALGAPGGAETHTLTSTEMPVHSHGVNDPGHFHTVNFNTGAGAGAGLANPVVSTPPHNASAGYVNVGSTGISIQNAGSGGAHNNLQPYALCGVIIKT